MQPTPVQGAKSPKPAIKSEPPQDPPPFSSLSGHVILACPESGTIIHLGDIMTSSTTLTSRPEASFTPHLRLSTVLAGAILIAFCSVIEIPLRPVPVTGQTFGVLYVAALLGPVQGTCAVLLYLTAGLAGLPVFSGGSFGVYQLFGPTGGYLVGFIAAAAVVGSLSGRNTVGRRLPVAVAMLLGTLVIYAFGVLRLSSFIGFERSITLGVLPFLPGDLFKLILASLLLPDTRITLPDGVSGAFDNGRVLR